MLSHRYFRLRSLGQLTLAAVAGDTESVATVRPRHLAVLTVLALSRRPVTRDALIAMFWGGEADTRARHSLSNALSGLRAHLGADAITSRQDRVELAAESHLEVDALQFVAACDVRDDARAIALYTGPLLADVHISDAPEFESWVARERGRLDRLFLEACERRVPVLSHDAQWRDAAALSERWLAASPRSSAAFIALLRAEAGPGSPSAITSALATYDRVRAALDESHDIRPDGAVTAEVDRLRTQLTQAERRLTDAISSSPSPVERAPSAAAASVTHTGSSIEEHASTNGRLARRESTASDISPAQPSRRRQWAWVALATASITLFAGALFARERSALSAASAPSTASEASRPIVAVTTIENDQGDSTVNWLRVGLPRMIATDLETMGGIEVVAPARVRDLLVRLTGSSLAQISDEQTVDVARRLGASWVVTGGVSTAKNGYLLDVSMRSTAGTAKPQSFTILANNPIDLGRMAASRLAAFLNVSPSGTAPRFSGVETDSPDAYRHFIRGMLAIDAERFGDAARELDAAIALDSGFVVAVRNRRAVAHQLGDALTDRRLSPLERRFQDRLPELDRLTDEVLDVDSLGENARANALADEALRRFPHDPRAYTLRAGVFEHAGQWAAAESIFVRELALDSLAVVAGDGPCTPCEVLWRLSQVRLGKGDRAGAEQAARRWVALQPDLPGAWRSLSATLAAVGRSNEAVQAGFHYLALTHESPALVEFARTMIVARRLDIADSLVRTWEGTSDPVLASGARDLGAMLARERGQFAASVAALSKIPTSNGLILVRADGLARVGRPREARAIFESAGHPTTAPRQGQFTAPEARGFTWAHALEADALVRTGDTTAARALTDSLESVGKQSYYRRDWLLHHHVRGLLFFAEGRFADAERELRAAEWAAGGWTRTNVELARTQLAERHPSDAIATLRDAYTAPLDAMGRYVPRSELDWWMARAFAAAGERDSASVYAGYTRAAWKNADAVVRARLDSVSR